LIVESGNVGIGTTSPSQKLHIVKNGVGNYAAYFESSGATNNYGMGGYSTGGTVAAGFIGGAQNATSINYGLYGIASGPVGSKNYALRGSASGGTENWGLYVEAGNAYIAGSLKIGSLEKTYYKFNVPADGSKSCLTICQAQCTYGIVTDCNQDQFYVYYSTTDGSCGAAFVVFDRWESGPFDPATPPAAVVPTCFNASGPGYDFKEQQRKVSGLCICP